MAGLTYHPFFLPSQADTKQDSPVPWTALGSQQTLQQSQEESCLQGSKALLTQ